MARTVAAAKPVAPASEGFRYLDGPVELRWAGEDFYTNVTLRPLGFGLTEVRRGGKGDWFHVDLADASLHMSPVMMGHGDTVGYMGTPIDGPVQYATLDQHRTSLAGGPVEWTEYDSVETLLVDLAFLHCS